MSKNQAVRAVEAAKPAIPDLEEKRREEKKAAADPKAAEVKKALEEASKPPPTKMAETDCLRWQRDQEKVGRLRAQEAFHVSNLETVRENLAALTRQVDSEQKAVLAKYKIGPEDRVNLETGIITRQPTAVPPAPKEE